MLGLTGAQIVNVLRNPNVNLGNLMTILLGESAGWEVVAYAAHIQGKGRENMLRDVEILKAEGRTVFVCEGTDNGLLIIASRKKS